MNFTRNLLHEFIDVISWKRVGDGMQLSLSMNAADEIFTEHFEGFPVLPGAYVVEIAQQLFMQYISQQALELASVKNMYFIQTISPCTPLFVEFVWVESNTGVSVSFQLKGPSQNILSRGLFHFLKKEAHHE